MSFESLTTIIVAFVRDHHIWAAPIVFMLAFLEALAFVSLLVPSTAILLALSALIGAAGLGFWPLWLAGGVGGVVGYSLSYAVGAYFGESAYGIWPFRNYPGLVARSKAAVSGARSGCAAIRPEMPAGRPWRTAHQTPPR